MLKRRFENIITYLLDGIVEAGPSPVVQAFVVGDCLKVGSDSVTTQIPLMRLTRVGKVPLSRTWKQEGRIAVFVTDLPHSNRLRRRRYANSSRFHNWSWPWKVSSKSTTVFC